jgi:hypothetical protein
MTTLLDERFPNAAALTAWTQSSVSGSLAEVVSDGPNRSGSSTALRVYTANGTYHRLIRSLPIKPATGDTMDVSFDIRYEDGSPDDVAFPPYANIDQKLQYLRFYDDTANVWVYDNFGMDRAASDYGIITITGSSYVHAGKDTPQIGKWAHIHVRYTGMWTANGATQLYKDGRPSAGHLYPVGWKTSNHSGAFNIWIGQTGTVSVGAPVAVRYANLLVQSWAAEDAPELPYAPDIQSVLAIKTGVSQVEMSCWTPAATAVTVEYGLSSVYGSSAVVGDTHDGKQHGWLMTVPASGTLYYKITATNLTDPTDYTVREGTVPLKGSTDNSTVLILNDLQDDSRCAASARFARQNTIDTLLAPGDISDVNWHMIEADGDEVWSANINLSVLDSFTTTPVYGLGLGNHDVDTLDSAAIFMGLTPMPSNYYSFDQGRVHFVVADLHNGVTMDATQLAYISANLAGSTQQWKVVVIHQAFNWSTTENPPIGEMFTNQEEFHAAMVAGGVNVVVNGHHHQMNIQQADGVHYISNTTAGSETTWNTTSNDTGETFARNKLGTWKKPIAMRGYTVMSVTADYIDCTMYTSLGVAFSKRRIRPRRGSIIATARVLK